MNSIKSGQKKSSLQSKRPAVNAHKNNTNTKTMSKRNKTNKAKNGLQTPTQQQQNKITTASNKPHRSLSNSTHSLTNNGINTMNKVQFSTRLNSDRNTIAPFNTTTSSSIHQHHDAPLFGLNRHHKHYNRSRAWNLVTLPVSQLLLQPQQQSITTIASKNSLKSTKSSWIGGSVQTQSDTQPFSLKTPSTSPPFSFQIFPFLTTPLHILNDTNTSFDVLHYSHVLNHIIPAWGRPIPGWGQDIPPPAEPPKEIEIGDYPRHTPQEFPWPQGAGRGQGYPDPHEIESGHSGILKRGAGNNSGINKEAEKGEVDGESDNELAPGIAIPGSI